MEDLNAFVPAFATPEVDPQYFTAVPSEESPMDRMISIFTSPKEALQGIEHWKGPSIWLWPLLVSLLLTAASFSIRYYTSNAADEEHVMRVQNYEHLSHNKNMSAEQRQAFAKSATEDTADPNKSAIFGFLIGFFTPMLSTLFSCLIFFLLARTIFKAEHVTYKMILTAASITLLISAAGDILALILQSVTGNGSMTMSPAAFMTGNPQSPEFLLAMQFNVFKIWDLVIFSLAFASLVRRAPTAGYAVVFTTWLVRVALWTGLTAMIQKISS